MTECNLCGQMVPDACGYPCENCGHRKACDE